MLLTLILMPLTGAIIILLVQKYQKEISLLNTLLCFSLSILLLIFSPSIQGYILIERWTSFLYFGLDSLSHILILLTNFIFLISIFSSWNRISTSTRWNTSIDNTSRINNTLTGWIIELNNSSLFYSTLLLLHSILIAVFLAIDILAFYVFFESSLIPMFLLIGLFGSRDRKKHAAYLFFLMTLGGSLVTLLAFLIISSEMGTFDYITISTLGISPQRQYILWLAIFLSFAVKTPIIPFHLWLPEAHTEANLPGSIILAGILLKLASYGFIRFSIGLLPVASVYFTPLIYGLSIISIIYSSISTLRQIDLKKIIAYSSIGHMSVVNIGIFSSISGNNFLGLDGAIYLMIAHGIVSPALFILVTLLYDRFHTRIIKYYRGMVYIMPIFSIYLIIFVFANMAIPLTGNFIGELLILTGSFTSNPFVTILAALGIILSGGYSIWFYNRIVYGKLTKYISDVKDISRIEFSLLLPLLILILLMGIIPFIILNYTQYSISYLL